MVKNELMALTGGFNSEAFGNLPAPVKRGIRQESSLVIKKTIVAGLHEQGRAMLTNVALENIGALSALEDHLCQVAPGGAERYKAVVDAYTFGACQTIARWQR